MSIKSNLNIKYKITYNTLTFLIVILSGITTKISTAPVHSSAADIREKRSEAQKIVENISKNFAEKGTFPTQSEIKKLKNLKAYLPKGPSKTEKDFTEMLKILESIPDSVLEDPKNDQEKKAYEKYNKKDLKAEDTEDKAK